MRGSGKNKKDLNHGEVKAYLQKVGADVFDTSDFGGGWPDLTVWFRRKLYMMEVKSGKNKLRPNQVAWREWWEKCGGTYCVIRDFDDIKEAFGI